MLSPSLRKSTLACAAVMLLCASGCDKLHTLFTSHSKTGGNANANGGGSYYDKLQPIVASHRVQGLHYADFSDYAAPVQTFYEGRNYATAWVDSNHPTAQAAAFIKAFQTADQKGLNPDDFDGSQWNARVQKLSSGSDDDVAQFDAAMTVSVMRYLKDLHMGRVNPTHFNFDIDTDSKKLNLPDLLAKQAIGSDDRAPVRRFHRAQQRRLPRPGAGPAPVPFTRRPAGECAASAHRRDCGCCARRQLSRGRCTTTAAAA